MGSRSYTIIFREGHTSATEIPKSIYRNHGYDDGTNVLSLLAFYENGKYFYSLKEEDRFFIANEMFGYHYGGASNEYTPERFKCGLEGSADAFLIERNGLKKACVAVNCSYVPRLQKIDVKPQKHREPFFTSVSNDVKGNKSFASSYTVHLYSLNNFLEGYIDEKYPSTKKIRELVKDFVEKNSIDLMNSDEFSLIMRRLDYIGSQINKQKNLEATAKLTKELSTESPIRYVKDIDCSARRTINPDFHNKYHKDLTFYKQFCQKTGSLMLEEMLEDVVKDFKVLKNQALEEEDDSNIRIRRR